MKSGLVVGYLFDSSRSSNNLIDDPPSLKRSGFLR